MSPEIIFFLAPFIFSAWLDLGFYFPGREEKIGDHPFPKRSAEHPWQEVFDFPDDESPVCLVSKFIIWTGRICDPDICIFFNDRRKIGIHHINKEILHDRKRSRTRKFFQSPLIFEFVVLWLDFLYENSYKKFWTKSLRDGCPRLWRSFYFEIQKAVVAKS